MVLFVEIMDLLCLKKLGMTFKNLVIDRRLCRAEKLMQENPGMTVEEIAVQCGYSDQFYFSRIYRKYRGIPPSEYRRSIF